jgi:hypothetical protein
MQLYSGKSIDQIPGAAGIALIVGLAVNQPALGVLLGTCVLAATAVAWAIAQNPPQHPSLSPWARS